MNNSKLAAKLSRTYYARIIAACEMPQSNFGDTFMKVDKVAFTFTQNLNEKSKFEKRNTLLPFSSSCRNEVTLVARFVTRERGQEVCSCVKL